MGSDPTVLVADPDPTVLVADTEPVFAEGVRGLVAATGLPVRVVAQLPAAAAGEARPGPVLVADSALVVGLAQVRRLARDWPRLVLVLRRVPPAGVSALLDGGVPVIVHRGCTPEELVAAVHAGAAGRSWLSPPMAQAARAEVRAGATGAAPPTTLSARELEVLAHLASGATNAGIADDLGVSPNTVRNHVRAVMAKLGATTRTEAVAIAARRGMVDL